MYPEGPRKGFEVGLKAWSHVSMVEHLACLLNLSGQTVVTTACAKKFDDLVM
jgi:hypothetical protein